MVIMEKERFKNDKIVIYQEDSVLNYSILTKTVPYGGWYWVLPDHSLPLSPILTLSAL